MAEIQLSVKVDGEKSLDEDWQKELEKIKNAMMLSAYNVQGVMAEVLEKHIQKDVYERYPEPKVYRRRKDEPYLGDSLTSGAYMDITDIVDHTNPDGSIEVSAGFTYNPSGEHYVSEWNTADGNNLIGRIENSYPPYTWPDGVPPRRPFWKRTVEELIEGGEIGKTVIQTMREAGITDFEMAYDEVMREGNDGKY